MGRLVSGRAVPSIRNSMTICRFPFLRNNRIISGHFQTSNDSRCLSAFDFYFNCNYRNEQEGFIDIRAGRHPICVRG